MKKQLKPKNDSEKKMNWDLLESKVQELQLPVDVFDRKALVLGKFKASYTFLVMLYFLQNLSENHGTFLFFHFISMLFIF